MKTHVLQSVFVAVFFAFQFTTHAQTLQGPLNPTLVTEQAAGCLSCPGATWSNHLNVTIPDNNYATVQLNAHSQCFFGLCFSRGLIATGFNFSIPSNTIIKGVKADVLRKASVANCIVDTLVQLWSNASVTGNNYASAGFWQTSPSYVSYGDSTDSWGATLYATDINSNDFGLFFQPLNLNLSNNCNADVDHVRLTVFYETASGIEEQSSENNLLYYYDNSNHIIHVAYNSKVKNENSICLYNLKGQMVAQTSLINSSFQNISTSGLSPGFYLIEINSDGRTFSRKVEITY